jgi:hypothetical protein
MLQVLGVSGFDSMDAVMRILAIALPVAGLLTLLLVLIAKWRSKRRRTSAPPLAPEIKPEIKPDVQEQPPRELPVVVSAPQVLRETPTALLTENPVDDMKARLNHSITQAPKSAQAPLYLEIAKVHRSQGDELACLSALRAAAGLAAQHGPHSAHAEARLELAEAAYTAGDLTGACEQWQIARTALLDDGQKVAHASVDKRMRDNGCPTDWVLTDF